MRKTALLVLPFLPVACGSSSPSQTGAISTCSGISLSGSGAFIPLSGMAFQIAADLGDSQTAAGSYDIVLWGNPGDAGTPTQSFQSVCSQLLNGALAVPLFVAPQTIGFNLPDSLPTGSSETTISDFTQPLSDSSVALEDIVGQVDIESVSTQCLTGNFSANLVPVDPTSGMAIDGGTATPVSGNFGLPFCM
jgi:hypothetical protein